MPEETNREVPTRVFPAEEYDKFVPDLHPAPEAGMNYGMEGPHPEKAPGTRTAYDYKEMHNRLQGFRDDELKEMPVMPEGSRLEQGATYVDLAEQEPKEFTARADMVAGSDNCYVPKTEVDYQLWNRLIGVENPERTGEADET